MARIRLALDPLTLPLYRQAFTNRGHTVVDDGPVDAVITELERAIGVGWLGEPSSERPAPMFVGIPMASFAPAVLECTGVLGVFDLADGPSAAIVAFEAGRQTNPPPTVMALPSPSDVRAIDPGAPDALLQQVVARIAAGLNVEVALVTLVGGDRQTFAAETGAPDDLARARGTPTSWSFCQHVVDSGRSLVVEDAQLHPVFRETPLVVDQVVRAYAGVPVVVAGGVKGAVCAISGNPHRFSNADMGLLELAAEAAGRHLTELAVKHEQRRSSGSRNAARPVDGVGTIVDGRWRLTARIGHGGQGDVWAAREVGSLRSVAVKIADGDAAAIEEARALASVQHPNMVSVHAAGRLPDGRGYIVMDHVVGAPLLDEIDAAGPRRDKFAFARLAEIAGALNSLHAAGFLHGDLKAANVLVDAATERAILIDLGLGLLDNRPSNSGLGTLGMSAPEQFDLRRPVLDTTVDTYGLAAVAYQMLTGRGPFKRTNPTAEMLDAQRADRWVPLSTLRADLTHLDAHFAQALSADPRKRPRSALTWAQDLGTQRLGALPGAPTRVDVIKALRAAIVERDGEDQWVIDNLPPMHRDAILDDSAAYIPTEAFLAYLAIYSGGSLGIVRTLAARVGAATARAMVRSMHAVFDPRTLGHAIPAFLRRLHPWVAVEVTEEGPAILRGELAMPFPGEILRTWIGAVIVAVFARAGALADVRWAPLGDDRYAIDVSWRSPT